MVYGSQFPLSGFRMQDSNEKVVTGNIKAAASCRTPKVRFYFEGTANELLRRISRDELPTIIEYVPG